MCFLYAEKTKRRTANSWIREAYFYIYIFSAANLNVSISGVEEQYIYAHSNSIRAKYNPLIRKANGGVFFTPIILHIGLLHVRRIALYYLGTLVEGYMSGRFVFIYIFAGFVGSLGSFIWNTSISAGAS